MASGLCRRDAKHQAGRRYNSIVRTQHRRSQPADSVRAVLFRMSHVVLTILRNGPIVVIRSVDDDNGTGGLQQFFCQDTLFGRFSVKVFAVRFCFIAGLMYDFISVIRQ